MTVPLALTAAAFGFTTTSVAAAVGQISADPTTTQWVTGSSAALAVGALAYIAKQFASGRLVSRDVAAIEAEMRARAAEQAHTVERVLKLAEMAHEREEMAHEREERLFNLLIKERP